jgi:hypothetical protein
LEDVELDEDDNEEDDDEEEEEEEEEPPISSSHDSQTSISDIISLRAKKVGRSDLAARSPGCMDSVGIDFGKTCSRGQAGGINSAAFRASG